LESHHHDTSEVGKASLKSEMEQWEKQDNASILFRAPQVVRAWLPRKRPDAHRLAVGTILRGRARSASGDAGQGISLIEDGIGDHRANGALLGLTCCLALKAEALHLMNRTSEALEAMQPTGAPPLRCYCMNALSHEADIANSFYVFRII
jgi:hypothetical protein